MIATNKWDKLIVYQTHEAGVNCISWAPLNTGDSYFVRERINYFYDLKTEDFGEKLAPLPKFATASSDKTVKIWEFVEGEGKFINNINSTRKL